MQAAIWREIPSGDESEVTERRKIRLGSFMTKHKKEATGSRQDGKGVKGRYTNLLPELIWNYN